jgi:hypothetical protein
MHIPAFETRRAQPNKALQLTRRRPGACQGFQPACGRSGGRFAGRPPDVSLPFTGGAQLSAVSVSRLLTKSETGGSWRATHEGVYREIAYLRASDRSLEPPQNALSATC